MKLDVFAIKDIKAGRFLDPYPGMNKATVQRDIMNVFKTGNKQSALVMNPEDYQLFKVGEFDQVSGLITSTEQEFVCNVGDLAQLVS